MLSRNLQVSTQPVKSETCIPEDDSTCAALQYSSTRQLWFRILLRHWYTRISSTTNMLFTNDKDDIDKIVWASASDHPEQRHPYLIPGVDNWHNIDSVAPTVTKSLKRNVHGTDFSWDHSYVLFVLAIHGDPSLITGTYHIPGTLPCTVQCTVWSQANSKWCLHCVYCRNRTIINVLYCTGTVIM